MRPTHLPAISDHPRNTREGRAEAVELSVYLTCEAAESGFGVSFLMRLTGADEAACWRAIEQAEDRGLVYTLGEGTVLLDEPGKRCLQEQRLVMGAGIRQRVAETLEAMNRERHVAEEERERERRESRRWARFMESESLNA
mgnify:CR=1 FL=1